MAKPVFRVRSLEFAGVIAEPGEPVPVSLPQIAIAGRSNVGKSSLLNRLLGRKRVARTSKRPGRTREIHFYAVNGRFALADLPGYGFARVPEEVRRQWGPLVESYLETSRDLLGLVLLLDARHGPSPDDARMLDYLARLGTPTLFALTKIDRVKRSERRGVIEAARRKLGAAEDQLLATSARTGEGIGALRASLAALLEEAGA